MNGERVGQVRGLLVDRVEVSTPLDPFLDLRALSAYSSLSVRKLRDLLEDSQRPIPSFRVGGKLLVRRSEFDAWMSHHRNRDSRSDARRIVDDVLDSLRPR